MKGVNCVTVSGNVGSINQGKTGDGVSAYSVLLAVESGKSNIVWVRVNVYSDLAKKCMDKIETGDYILVEGELMERKRSFDDTMLIEIRARNVIFASTIRRKSFIKEAVQIVKESDE